jgi:hypothetical protein
MTGTSGTSSLSFCNAELLRRPILRAIWVPTYLLKETLFVPPWWSWYVLDPSLPAKPLQ